MRYFIIFFVATTESGQSLTANYGRRSESFPSQSMIKEFMKKEGYTSHATTGILELSEEDYNSYFEL